MASLRSSLPAALALAAALVVAPAAEAAGGGYGSSGFSAASASRSASASTSAPSSRSMRSMFDGKPRTETHREADGSSQTVTTQRRGLLGRQVDVVHKDAKGATIAVTSTKTRTTFFGLKQTDHTEHHADGSSSFSTTKNHRRDGRVMSGRSVERDSAGNMTSTRERRGAFSQQLRRYTVVNDANGKTVATSADTYRHDDTIKKSVVNQNGHTYKTTYDKHEQVKQQTVEPQTASKR